MILAVISDLITKSRVQGAADKLQVEIEFASTLEEVKEKQANADLVILDLNDQQVNAIEALSKITTRAIGFAGHLQTELLEKAEALGCDTMTNGEFMQQLSTILTAEKTIKSEED